MTQSLVLEGLIRPDQQLTYVHVPFEVPPGIGRIEVSYTYDSAISADPTVTGGNTVDIGIFDARGIGFCSPGYRGWSGSARRSFTIGVDAATPGYLPGPIMPGTWHICLGAYKVAPQGCQYRVDVLLFPSETAAQAQPPTLLRLSDTPSPRVHADGWYKGELHNHTVHSDGDSTPEEIVRLAESLGLDFLAITDHNNQSQGIELATMDTRLMLIPGYEVTTYFGHWNIWGDGGWIDFRVQSADDMARSIAEATAQGYLVSCNHPRPHGPEWTFTQVDGYRCVEIWNGPWELLNTVSLGFWEDRLNAGQRLVAVGGSDNHFTKRRHMAHLGTPTTYLYCPEAPSPARLVQALRAGHAFLTESPDGPRLELASGAAMMGDVVPRPGDGSLPLQIRARGGAGAHLQIVGEGIFHETEVAADDFQIELAVDAAGARWVRAQLADPATTHIRAITNPIYVD